MGVVNRVYSNTFTYFDATLLDLTFQVCDPGILNPCIMLKIVNTSDANVIISYDGVHGHDVILASSDIVLPFQEGSRQPGHKAMFARGTPVYLMAENGAAQLGEVFIISYYQPIIG